MTAGEVLSAASRLATNRGIDAWGALMLVLLGHLKDLEFPEPVRPVVDIAETYWVTNDRDRTRLAAAKRVCWTYLDSFDRGQDLVAMDGRRVRALLCVLEPDADEEAASQTAEWFIEMVGGV